MHVRDSYSSDERRGDDIGVCGRCHLVESCERSMVVEVKDVNLRVDEDGTVEDVLKHRLIVVESKVSGCNSDL